MKRQAGAHTSHSQPRKRPARSDAFTASPAPSLDHLVRALAAASSTAAPPVWSSHTNLVALALPTPAAPAPPLFTENQDLFTPPLPSPALAVQLTHLAGTGAAHPRVQTRLDVPLPLAFPAAGAHISHLSFAPDGTQLLVVVSTAPAAGADDLVTVFEQRSSCVDDWACVLQESVGRFGGARTAGGHVGKHIVSTRWVGEPRRWYPSPTFPDAREQAKKPLYCAPPRSAPLSGTAFVAVLSSEEILFIHLPNASTSPVQPGGSVVLPSVVCLPLRPAPSTGALPPSDLSTTADGPSAPSNPGLSFTAVPTPPTPLPLSLPRFPTAAAPAGAAVAASAETPTPQATIDALVSSLLPTLPLAGGAPPPPAGAAATGVSGTSALADELRLASTAAAAEQGGAARGRGVGRAAVGAGRSRGDGETTFVVVWRAAALTPGAPGVGAPGSSRRGSRAEGAARGTTASRGEGEAARMEEADEKKAVPEDDFALLADFASLDEAFGAPPLPAAAATMPAEVNGTKDAGVPHEDEDKAELEAWAEVLERDREDPASSAEKWRVELAEVRVEMGAMEGHRLTVRPQPPLYLNPSPASPPDSAAPAADPLLTHLTFLGDVALPHPLQLTSQSPSLASDGSEPAIDLCLLAVFAHPSSSPRPGGAWRSTLSSYALSREEAYPLSEAFHTLEGRRLDAPNAVDGEGAWAARHAATAPVGRAGEGALCAVEIRPGGGEWASVVGVVAEPQEGEGEGWRSRVLRLSSVTLEPLHKTPDGAEDESAALVLPGAQLFSALTTSPNGALLCAIPFAPPPVVAPAQPVLAASPLGPPDELAQRLATRFAIGIARQGDVSDLVGRVRGMRDKDTTLAVVQHAYEILGAMLPSPSQLDASALGLELLGVTASLFRGMPGLDERANAAERMLELAACARALKRAERRERGAAPGVWKPDSDATWPLVGYAAWFCGPFLDGLLSASLASPSAPTLLVLLHPLFRGLLNSATSALQALAAHLAAERAHSEQADVARVVVDDALARAAGGKGLAAWVEVLARVRVEADGGPAASSLSPPLLASLVVPPAFEAKSAAVHALLSAAFPDMAARARGTAPPTPPRSPSVADHAATWDVVRRARLDPRAEGGSARTGISLERDAVISFALLALAPLSALPVCMAPKGKSSTSKATQKKHAAKAARKAGKHGGDDDGDGDAAPVPVQGGGMQRGQKKLKKKDRLLRPKQYIAPVKPKGDLDPVDLFLVQRGKQLDPALVVTLRGLAKRDDVTLAKAAEALDAWIRDTLRQDRDADGEEWERQLRQEGVVDAMDVWAHHFPRLALHPSRRLRLQVHALHALLTSTSHPLLRETRAALLAPLWTDRSDYVGAWCTAAHDSDRTVRREAKASWDAVQRGESAAERADDGDEAREGISLVEHADAIASFCFSVILGGSDPSAPSGTSTPLGASAAPVQSEPEDPAFLRTSALLALASLVGSLPAPLPLSRETLDTLTSEEIFDLVVRAEPGSRQKEQPQMVRRAVYELLGALVARSEDLLAETAGKDEEPDEDSGKVAQIAARVLANCWTEEEGWPGIIAFLRRYPRAWTLADHILSNDDDEDADGAEAETDTDAAFKASPTMSLFLQHLTLGCSSHPTSLYPTVLLLLSTLPVPFTPPLPPASFSLLFDSFWAAHYSRALAVGGRLALDAFTSALLECVVFSLPPSTSPSFAAAQTRVWIGERAWRAFLGTLPADDPGAGKPLASRRVATEIATALSRLAAREDPAAFEAVWAAVGDEALDAAAGDDGAPLEPLAMALRAFVRAKDERVRSRAADLVGRCVRKALEALQQGETAREERLRFVVDVAELVKGDADVAQVLDEFALLHLPSLLPTSPAALSLFTSHLSSASPSSRATIWQSLFSTSPAPAALLRIVQAVTNAGLAADLPSAEQDERLTVLAGTVLAPEARYTADELELLRRVMLQPQPLASADLPQTLLRLAADALAGPVDSALASSSPRASLAAVVAPAALLAHFVQLPDNARAALESDDTAAALFELGHLVPLCGAGAPDEAVAAAQQAWAAIVAVVGDTAVEKVMGRLRARVADAQSRASAIEVVHAGAALLETLPSSHTSLADVLPAKADVEALYAAVRLVAPAPSLAILDPLVPAVEASYPAPSDSFDASFLSPYARALLALLEVSARDHTLLRRAHWALPHLLLLASAAADELAHPSPPSRSAGVFAPDVPQEVLERVRAAADGASSYLLSSAANALPDGWHAAAVAHLRARDLPPAPASGGELLAGLDGLWRVARGASADEDPKVLYAARAVRSVLNACLRYTEDGGVQDAERWLALAQNLASAPDLACAILYAIKPVLLETPRFERFQNELAASVAGVKPHEVETKAAPLLRQLLAVAPALDAPVIFLPQQRSVFLLQAVQRWLSSDERVPPEVHAALVEVLVHLAPIVQDLSGSHWDVMFDLVEGNLDAADWEEAVTLPAVYGSCRLLATIKELAATNGELRETVKARISASQELVLRLFISRPPSNKRDQPRLLVVEAMAKLVQDLPPKLLNMDKSFEQLLRLLQDPAWAVQLSSYDLLRRVVTKNVSDLVVEAELDAEESLDIKLPAALVQLLQRRVDEEDEEAQTTAYLLAWLTAFSFFDSSSPRLRAAYIEQLRDTGIVVDSLLPSLFGLLSLSDRGRAFDLSPWSIDDFHLELFDATAPESLPILAAHVYYRSLQAVPSIIRTYWTSLQNLGFSRAVHSFTSKHFSPLLISDELATLRDPSSPVGQQLRDNDDFTVKVAANASEVKVVFVVDEESMEIGIKVPSEFPLAAVEVREVRKVGVTDKQWRAWLLAMQQVITSQSAAIADAILLFKRNVTLNFEGIEGCAICYSTVSTLDRTLPSKTCKTCNNRFHASCLYKWFTTSHGSTCPLCRQLF
ncbi:hypothetical protein JCM3770_002829 [Rhodotorula araucariae]